MLTDLKTGKTTLLPLPKFHENPELKARTLVQILMTEIELKESRMASATKDLETRLLALNSLIAQ